MKILYIPPSRIGDAVMSLSVLEGLNTRYSSFHYTVAADPLVLPLFQDDKRCTSIIPFPKQRHSLHWFNLWLQTFRTKWDIVIDTRGSALAFALYTKKRYVWHQIKNDIRPKIEQLCDFAKVPLTCPRLHFSKERLTQLKPLFLSAPLLIIAPIANWVGKQWPLSYFENVIDKFLIKFPNAHVIALSAPHEHSHILELKQLLSSPRFIDGTQLIIDHSLTLLDVAALMSLGQLFLGNDSGLMHMAYAVNLPVIALFGPSKEYIYGPYPINEKHMVLRTPQTYEELSSMPNFSHKAQVCYMEGLKPDIVYTSLCQKWESLQM